MKILIFIVCLLCNTFILAQGGFEKPDYDQIEKNIENKNSHLYYPTLMSRYVKGDSTLTTEENRHLYYGYTFQEEYSPYSITVYRDSLTVELQKSEWDHPTLRNIIRHTNKMLEENPLNLDALSYQIYALNEMGDKQQFNIRVAQLRSLMDALVSSGNGISKEQAIYVIRTSDEYYLIDIFGFEVERQALIEHYDYLTLAENEEGVEGLYFDVSPCLNSLSKMMQE